jgi:NADH-quinone oxidoreductase subunit E
MHEEARKRLQEKLARTDHPQELAVDVMYQLQKEQGYMTDEALLEGASLLDMTPLELEELATFYDFIYRERVGRYVIHACDGVVCWMFGKEKVIDYLSRKLEVEVGETTADGLFTILPSACIGDCDHAPSMLINGVPHGSLTPQKIDDILHKLKTERCELSICR